MSGEITLPDGDGDGAVAAISVFVRSRLPRRSSSIRQRTYLGALKGGDNGVSGVLDLTNAARTYATLSSDVRLPAAAPPLGLGIAALVAGASRRRKA